MAYVTALPCKNLTILLRFFFTFTAINALPLQNDNFLLKDPTHVSELMQITA